MAALIGFTAAENPIQEGCTNLEARYYGGDDQRCIDVWKAWDYYCMSFEAIPGECIEIENEMYSIQDEENLALLGATEEFQEASQEAYDHSGLIIGASATVIGAAAAILALRKCTNKSQIDSFERVI